LAIFEVLPNFDLKKYEFELCKGFFHGKNGPHLSFTGTTNNK
jgi:hypothetical protein